MSTTRSGREFCAYAGWTQPSLPADLTATSTSTLHSTSSTSSPLSSPAPSSASSPALRTRNLTTDMNLLDSPVFDPDDPDSDPFSEFLLEDDLSEFDALQAHACRRYNAVWEQEEAERRALWDERPWPSPASSLSDLPDVSESWAWSGGRLEGGRTCAEEDVREVGEKRKRASSVSDAEDVRGNQQQEKRVKKKKKKRASKGRKDEVKVEGGDGVKGKREGASSPTSHAERAEGEGEKLSQRKRKKRRMAMAADRVEGEDGAKAGVQDDAKPEGQTGDGQRQSKRGPKTEQRKQREREKRKLRKQAEREQRKAAGLPARKRSEASEERRRRKKAWKRALKYWVGAPGSDGYFLPSVCEAKWGEPIEVERTKFNAADMSKAEGCYVGVNRPVDKDGIDDNFTIAKAIKAGARIIEWDGCETRPIIDKKGRIIAVLLGRPKNDPSWEVDVTKGLADAMEEVRREGDKLGAWVDKQEMDRRLGGQFVTLSTGVSYGGGQKEPGVLKPKKTCQQPLIDKLHRCIGSRRAAGFASSGFQAYAPKLWHHYARELFALYNFNDDRCRPLFKNSIFPAATWNLGPQCVCKGHCDSPNVPYGWCAVCSVGKFDPKKGGHLYLVELKLLVEFPPGSVVLIPSSTVRHGNTPIQPGETRYSFTGFCAGGLLRWVDHGFVPDWFYTDFHPDWLRESETTTEKWGNALKLYSTLESRHGDWAKLYKPVKKMPVRKG